MATSLPIQPSNPTTSTNNNNINATHNHHQQNPPQILNIKKIQTSPLILIPQPHSNLYTTLNTIMILI